MLALQTRAQATEPTELTFVFRPCFISSGVITTIELIGRATGEVFSLPIISRYPLRPQEIKDAIAKATGKTHWDYQWQVTACNDYEF